MATFCPILSPYLRIPALPTFARRPRMLRARSKTRIDPYGVNNQHAVLIA